PPPPPIPSRDHNGVQRGRRFLFVGGGRVPHRFNQGRFRMTAMPSFIVMSRFEPKTAMPSGDPRTPGSGPGVKPMRPRVPATVVTTPPGVILRTRKLAESAT